MAEPAEVLRRVEQLRAPRKCSLDDCQRPARGARMYCSSNCAYAATERRAGRKGGLPLASRRYAERLELERIYREGGLKG